MKKYLAALLCKRQAAVVGKRRFNGYLYGSQCYGTLAKPAVAETSERHNAKRIERSIKEANRKKKMGDGY